MFEEAAKVSRHDLAPFWLFEECENPVKVRRIVPIIKWSREDDYWPRLQDKIATYRLVMGLPRQEDLAVTLEQNGVTPEQARRWRITLSPTSA